MLCNNKNVFHSPDRKSRSKQSILYFTLGNYYLSVKLTYIVKICNLAMEDACMALINACQWCWPTWNAELWSWFSL